ncbi:hypothetical protein BDQ12DRAFT_306625 [Crucibulum laeve]|uniref:Uncharacterized protein n=1 Tax=Crucibulum laeve TaxID=68775 RepID=A0A5C3LSC7_9AGAR|nr:hypothetical protein BDQ12DRAFT_306625 [Crucibulum laeve]
MRFMHYEHGIWVGDDILSLQKPMHYEQVDCTRQARQLSPHRVLDSEWSKGREFHHWRFGSMLEQRLPRPATVKKNSADEALESRAGTWRMLVENSWSSWSSTRWRLDKSEIAELAVLALRMSSDLKLAREPRTTDHERMSRNFGGQHRIALTLAVHCRAYDHTPTKSSRKRSAALIHRID